MPRPRLVFAGSSDFAVPSLDALVDERWTLAGVLTQPDRPAGRRRRMSPTPVAARAREHGLAVQTPASLRSAEALAALSELRPDALVVVDYGLILPQAVLDLPSSGCINGHASLLPRWRGAAPVQHAILAGDRFTGVSIMSMDKGLDTGPVYKMQSLEIRPGETGGELRERLAFLCAELLHATLPDILAGRLKPEPQDHAAATYAGKLDPEAARIDWQMPATELARRICAFAPRPGAWTTWRGQRLKLHRALPLPVAEAEAAAAADAAPGRVWQAGAQGIDVSAGAGGVRVLELQPPGGRVMSAGDFLNSRALLGEQLGA